MRTLYNDTLAVQALNTAAQTTGAHNGTTVDLAKFNNNFRSVLFVVQTGAATDGSHVVSLQDSPDGTTWNNVAAGQLLGSAPTITAADSNKAFALGLVPQQRYCRVVVTTSGATTGAVIGAVAVLGSGDGYPTAKS